jgi:hypothetical protein
MKSSVRESLLIPSLILLGISMAVALGGGFYEGVVLTPLWSSQPPASFTLIHPGEGVPLQTFWIPVHGVISFFALLSLWLGWHRREVRWRVVVGLTAYIVMRVWSFAFFIPELLEFQSLATDAIPSDDLTRRVEQWTTLTWLRLPLDAIAVVAFSLALSVAREPRAPR